jgi:hypothetical protein
MRIYLLTLLIFISCNSGDKKEAPKDNHTKLNYSGYGVVIFLSPECPLSENYTSTINELYKTYSDSGISFSIIFPGDLYTNEEIKMFIDSFHVALMYKVDREKNLTNRLKATITPEAFLVDRSGTVIYSGAIDNRAIELTKLRQTISEHYLRDAIEAVLADQPIKIKKTEAIGCIIE